jgi:hypothetical protein
MESESPVLRLQNYRFRAQVLQRLFHLRFYRAGLGQSELLGRHRLTTTRLRLRRIGHWGGLLQNSHFFWGGVRILIVNSMAVFPISPVSTLTSPLSTLPSHHRRAVVGQQDPGFSNSIILRPVPAARSSFIIPCVGVGSPIVAHRLAQFLVEKWQSKLPGRATRKGGACDIVRHRLSRLRHDGVYSYPGTMQ